MNRGVVAALLLFVCACGKERPDPRIGELTSPVHITVRTIDAPVEKECQGTTWEQLKCSLTRAERQGCTYVEVGAAAEKPELNKSVDVRRCHAMDGRTRDVLVHQPAKKATITLDASKRRALIEVGDGAYAVYLRDGEVVAHRKVWEVAAPGSGGLTLPPGTVDWLRVPPYLSVLDEQQLVLKLSEAELDALIAESPTGKSDLKSALSSLTRSADLSGEGWARAVSKLDEPDRMEIRDELARAVSGGSIGALDWFKAHPEEQKPDYVDALAEAAETESFDLSAVLPELSRLDPARAEAMACEHLERRWHEYGSMGYEYDYNPPSAAALAVLVTRKAKCPWVVPLLLRQPCGAELRCDPDLDDLKPTPLCTPQQTEKALQRALTPESELSDEDYQQLDSDWGPLLVAAARLQGPLPPDFLRADERRLYKQRYTFKGAEIDDACRQLSTEPVDWACRLPASITTANYESCTLVLDDEKKTMTLSAPPLEEDE